LRLFKKYEVNGLGISSPKYLLNHIEEYLLDNNFNIIGKDDSSIEYRDSNYLISTWSLASRAKAGQIRIKVKDNIVSVELSFSNLDLIFLSLSVVIFYFYVLNNEYDSTTKTESAIILLIVLTFLFGGNFMSRYLANKSMLNQIDLLIKNLST
jgi:hypothetical protein